MIINGPRPFKQRTKQGITLAPMKSGRIMMRMKSSLDAKRVKQDPAFKPLMQDAAMMKRASPLAAGVYRELEIKDVKVYRKMVGRAKTLLKEGIREREIENILKKEYGKLWNKPVARIIVVQEIPGTFALMPKVAARRFDRVLRRYRRRKLISHCCYDIRLLAYI